MFLMSVDPFSHIHFLKAIWALVAFAVAWGGRYWVRMRAHNWQPTFGKIEGYLPLRGEPGEPPLGVGYLQYSYSVSSDYYAGELVLTRLQTQLDIDGLKAAIPVGSSIEVRYDPSNPEVSLATLPRVHQLAPQVNENAKH